MRTYPRISRRAFHPDRADRGDRHFDHPHRPAPALPHFRPQDRAHHPMRQQRPPAHDGVDELFHRVPRRVPAEQAQIDEYWFNTHCVGRYIRAPIPMIDNTVAGGVLVCPADLEGAIRSYSMNLFASSYVSTPVVAAIEGPNPPGKLFKAGAEQLEPDPADRIVLVLGSARPRAAGNFRAVRRLRLQRDHRLLGQPAGRALWRGQRRAVPGRTLRRRAQMPGRLLPPSQPENQPPGDRRLRPRQHRLPRRPRRHAATRRAGGFRDGQEHVRRDVVADRPGDWIEERI